MRIYVSAFASPSASVAPNSATSVIARSADPFRSPRFVMWQADITTLVGTSEGIHAFTHVWWHNAGPSVDPLAEMDEPRISRARILQVAKRVILGYGKPFIPGSQTPRLADPWTTSDTSHHRSEQTTIPALAVSNTSNQTQSERGVTRCHANTGQPRNRTQGVVPEKLPSCSNRWPRPLTRCGVKLLIHTSGVDIDSLCWCSRSHSKYDANWSLPIGAKPDRACPSPDAPGGAGLELRPAGTGRAERLPIAAAVPLYPQPAKARLALAMFDVFCAAP